MGITNMYPNLPGHLVEFKDGGLQLTSLPEDGSGYSKSLLILGTALDGPIKEPVKIDAKTVTQLFGSEVNDKNYPNGATLTKYAKQAFAHGFTDVRCMRVTGTEATKTIIVSSDNTTTNVDKVAKPVKAVAGHPAAKFSFTEWQDGSKNLLPVSTDEGKYSQIWLCTAPPANGEARDIITADNIVYAPTDGYITLPANTVNKNATVYAVYYHQNIKGKGEGTGNALTPFTAAIVNGKTVADTMSEPILASSFGAESEEGITFKLLLSSEARLYSQAYRRTNTGNEVLEKDCYPQTWNLIQAFDASLTEEEAKKKSIGLKVVIVGKYEDHEGNTVSRVLDADEFQVIEKTEDPDQNPDVVGKVFINSGEYGYEYEGEVDVPNDAYVDEDTTPGIDPTIKEKKTLRYDTAYTEYNVAYFTYTNDFTYNTIKLADIPTSIPGASAESEAFNNAIAEADEFELYDDKKAIPGSIRVTRADGSDVDPRMYEVVAGENDVHTKIVVAPGNAVMGTQYIINYQVEERTTSEKVVVFKSIYGGEVYNQARVKMEKSREDVNTSTGELGEEYVKITFYKPESKYYTKTEVPFYYKSTDVPTVGQLRDFLKNYELNNVFAIETDDDDITLEELYDGVCANVTPSGDADNVILAEFNLVGGSSGINPTDEELFVALSGKRDANGYLTERGAYQILENYHCDYIYPAGAKADKSVVINGRKQSFQYELALVCAVLTYRTKMTHGFIDVSPNSNTSLVGIQKHVDKLLAMPNLFYMQDNKGDEILDSEGKRMDIGWYTSVVVGPDPVMISDTLGTYYGSAALAYAALVASLKPQSSPMNKALPKVKGMKYKFSNKQMDSLIGNRMVCFRLKNEGTTTASSVPYCVDAMTAGGPECDYARMTTVSIVTDVVDQIREVADPFIGEPNTIEQRNALSALIAKRLSRIYEKGEVTYYSFEINATIQQVLLGECTISLTLVCPMELRKITTVVSLRAAA